MPRKPKEVSEAEKAILKGEAVARIEAKTKAKIGRPKKGERSGRPRGRTRGKARANSRQRVLTEIKCFEAYEYRVMGYSLQQIGEFMSLSVGRVCELIAGYKKFRREEEIEQVKQIHVDRVAQMRAGLASAAMGGDPMAIDRMIKLDEREAKLRGFDVAEKIEIIDNTDPRKVMHAEIGAIFQRLAMQNLLTDEHSKQMIDVTPKKETA